MKSLSVDEHLILNSLSRRENNNNQLIWYYFAGGSYAHCFICSKSMEIGASSNDDDGYVYCGIDEHGLAHLKEHGLLAFI